MGYRTKLATCCFIVIVHVQYSTYSTKLQYKLEMTALLKLLKNKKQRGSKFLLEILEVKLRKIKIKIMFEHNWEILCVVIFWVIIDK